MIKTGAAKIADIKIPEEQSYNRLKQLVSIKTTVSTKASENLNYYMTMFSKEHDFLRYLRMQNRSPILK
jgi:hypothetical protein|tara:strand:- start:1 stop:207 length:207 start_codon:yes stop_codon:yes gene_type:complete